MILLRLDTDRPQLARCAGVLRALLDDVDLAALDRAVTGATTEELGELRDDLGALVDELDDTAHRSDDDADRLDQLGAPVDGGRWTIECDRPEWTRAVIAAAAGEHVDPDRAARYATRVRVVVDLRGGEDGGPGT